MKQTLHNDLRDSMTRRICWWGIVQDYSARGLTKLKDKLPALAGIIQYIEDKAGDNSNSSFVERRPSFRPPLAPKATQAQSDTNPQSL